MKDIRFVANESARLIDFMLSSKIFKATKFMSETLIVRATRRLYDGKIDKRDNFEVLITIGKPNFAERKFIKLCKKAGEPFPIKKPLLKELE